MKLRTYLKEHSETATAFASRIGVSVSSVSRLANGKREPDLELALKIRDATGGLVQFEDMLKPANDPPQQARAG
ncbi:MAG TPA: helix-turn-helix transcriptional regulator [Pararhizobium sp.]|nr:helix-turn-helix transcriptional regulator [Pararhizobium sp.]